MRYEKCIFYIMVFVVEDDLFIMEIFLVVQKRCLVIFGNIEENLILFLSCLWVKGLLKILVREKGL